VVGCAYVDEHVHHEICVCMFMIVNVYMCKNVNTPPFVTMAKSRADEHPQKK
jgi:hypothetical protein